LDNLIKTNQYFLRIYWTRNKRKYR